MRDASLRQPTAAENAVVRGRSARRASIALLHLANMAADAAAAFTATAPLHFQRSVELEAILRSFELGTRGTIVALEFKVR